MSLTFHMIFSIQDVVDWIERNTERTDCHSRIIRASESEGLKLARAQRRNRSNTQRCLGGHDKEGISETPRSWRLILHGKGTTREGNGRKGEQEVK